MSERLDQARSYHTAIREVLMREWDPIGVADIPEAADEYDSYISEVHGLIIRREPLYKLVDFLWWVETEHMGWPATAAVPSRPPSGCCGFPARSRRAPNPALQQTAGHDSFLGLPAYRCPAAAELGRSAAEGVVMASAGRASAGGRDLRCQHCGHEQFLHQTAMLDQVAWGGLLHFEGAWGQHTDIFACARCGFAHFFIPVPGVAHAADTRPAEPLPEESCLSCGKPIPGAATKCPDCGWAWSADRGGEG